MNASDRNAVNCGTSRDHRGGTGAGVFSFEYSPDLVVLCLVWSIVLPLQLLGADVLGFKFPGNAVSLVLASVCVFIFVRCASGRSVRPLQCSQAQYEAQVPLMSVDSWTLAFALIGLCGAGLLLITSQSSDLSSLYEVRRSTVNTFNSGEVTSSIITIVYTAAQPCTFISVFLIITSTGPMLMRVSSSCICLISVTIPLFVYGARTDLVTFVWFAAACAVSLKIWMLRKHAKAILITALIGSAMFAGLNVLLNMLRSVHGTLDFHQEANLTVGVTLLNSVGIADPSEILCYTVSLLYGYFGSPIVMLDHFLETYDQYPMFGLYEFASLRNRLAFIADLPGHYEIKVYIDRLYLDLGIHHNVWATGFREVVVDMSRPGVLLGMAGFGSVMGMLARRRFHSRAAAFLFALGVTWILQSPFTNAFLNRAFEVAVLYGVVGIYCSYLQRRARARHG